ncbi:hypothetical protein DFR29_10497 [Tahibacter aquaticus]|uniref:Multidrug efflux pump subunit AcrA (Membrane-fusion protein) n=1 Tax=Tahibacter aquaticus TaxID=520092 RepID=A0A4R6Z2G9_9GAMM|nr:hypothetical protein [Tahibacter aquaticus]TDR45669.1 hypothetical protein DFR29_10497 [Tahibacter aquaticus]
MSRSRVVQLGLCVGLACASAASAEVSLTPAQRDNLGVRTTVLQAVAASQQVSAIARVVDPLPWIKLDGDWRAAVAVAQAAQREAERSQRLHAAESTVSGRALEAADAQVVAENARRDGLDAERRLTMGAGLAGLGDAARRRLFDDLVKGRARVLRFEALGIEPAGTVFDGASLVDDASAPSIEWLGRAPQANPTNLAPGFLGIAHGLDASPGEVIGARLHKPGTQVAARVPAAALLRWNKATWVYRQRDAQTFVRTAIRLVHPLDDGDWLATGVKTGDAVAVAGAAALLSADRAQVPAGEVP